MADLDKNGKQNYWSSNVNFINPTILELIGQLKMGEPPYPSKPQFTIYLLSRYKIRN
jgi:hypothetical protein